MFTQKNVEGASSRRGSSKRRADDVVADEKPHRRLAVAAVGDDADDDDAPIHSPLLKRAQRSRSCKERSMLNPPPPVSFHSTPLTCDTAAAATSLCSVSTGKKADHVAAQPKEIAMMGFVNARSNVRVKTCEETFPRTHISPLPAGEAAPASQPAFVGFVNARTNVAVTVSEKALATARAGWKEDEGDENRDTLTHYHPAGVGHSTNGLISVSSADLETDRAKMRDDVSPPSSNLSAQPPVPLVGFVNARTNAAVSVSAEALTRARVKMEGEGNEIKPLMGFINARTNGAVSISEEARVRMESQGTEEAKPLHVLGFVSARTNAVVAVSEEALEKARCRLEEGSLHAPTPPPPMLGSVNAWTNSTIAVSDASLAKARAFLEEDRPSTPTTPQCQLRVGFVNAHTNARISVSEEALSKARRALEQGLTTVVAVPEVTPAPTTPTPSIRPASAARGFVSPLQRGAGGGTGLAGGACSPLTPLSRSMARVGGRRPFTTPFKPPTFIPPMTAGCPAAPTALSAFASPMRAAPGTPTVPVTPSPATSIKAAPPTPVTELDLSDFDDDEEEKAIAPSTSNQKKEGKMEIGVEYTRVARLNTYMKGRNVRGMVVSRWQCVRLLGQTRAFSLVIREGEEGGGAMRVCAFGDEADRTERETPPVGQVVSLECVGVRNADRRIRKHTHGVDVIVQKATVVRRVGEADVREEKESGAEPRKGEEEQAVTERGEAGRVVEFETLDRPWTECAGKSVDLLCLVLSVDPPAKTRSTGRKMRVVDWNEHEAWLSLCGVHVCTPFSPGDCIVLLGVDVKGAREGAECVLCASTCHVECADEFGVDGDTLDLLKLKWTDTEQKEKEWEEKEEKREKQQEKKIKEKMEPQQQQHATFSLCLVGVVCGERGAGRHRVWVKGCVVEARADAATYLGCRQCRRKMHSDSTACRHCRAHAHPAHYYHLKVELCDFSGSHTATMFDSTARQLLGMEAEEAAKMNKYNADAFRGKIRSTFFRPHLFLVEVDRDDWKVEKVERVDYTLFLPYLQNMVNTKQL